MFLLLIKSLTDLRKSISSCRLVVRLMDVQRCQSFAPSKTAICGSISLGVQKHIKPPQFPLLLGVSITMEVVTFENVASRINSISLWLQNLWPHRILFSFLVLQYRWRKFSCRSSSLRDDSLSASLTTDIGDGVRLEDLKEFSMCERRISPLLCVLLPWSEFWIR